MASKYGTQTNLKILPVLKNGLFALCFVNDFSQVQVIEMIIKEYLKNPINILRLYPGREADFELMNVRIANELRTKFQYQCKVNSLTMSRTLRYLITEYLKSPEHINNLIRENLAREHLAREQEMNFGWVMHKEILTNDLQQNGNG